MPGCGDRLNDPLLKNATCLLDNVLFGALELAKDEVMHFHWRLANAERSIISNLDEDDAQRLLTFRVTTCFGNVHFYVNALQDFPTSTKSMFAPEKQDKSLLSIGIPVNFVDYFVTVKGIAPQSNFTISALLGKAHVPKLGAGGKVWTEPRPPGRDENDNAYPLGLIVRWNTSDIPNWPPARWNGEATKAKYLLYWIERKDNGKCAGASIWGGQSNNTTNGTGSLFPTASTNTTVNGTNGTNGSPVPSGAGQIDDCIVETNCGLVRSATAEPGGFVELDRGKEETRVLEFVENHKTYFVNVAMIYPNGMPAAYIGAQGTLDYSRVTQAVEDSTSITIAVIVGVILLGFGGFVVYAKRSIANAHIYDQLPQSIMPGIDKEKKKRKKKGEKRGEHKGAKENDGGDSGRRRGGGGDKGDTVFVDDDNGKGKKKKRWNIAGW